MEFEHNEQEGYSVYRPVDPRGESIALAPYLWDTEPENGAFHLIPGAFGTATFMLNQGQWPHANFEFMGLYQQPLGGIAKTGDPDFSEFASPKAVGVAGTTTLRLITQDGNDLATAAGMDASRAGKAVLPPLVARSFELSLNHTNAWVADYSAAGGRIEQVRGSAKGRASFIWHTVEQFDHFKSSIDGGTFGLAIEHAIDDFGNGFLLWMPRVQSINPTYQMENGRIYVSVEFNVISPGGLGDVLMYYFRDKAARAAITPLLTPFADSAAEQPPALRAGLPPSMALWMMK